MDARPCDRCFDQPAMRCGRCATTRCLEHAFEPGRRCDACEGDWTDEAPTRRAAKLIFAPPISILAGGILFGLLLPISLGGAIGAAIMCTVACCTAVAAGASACKLVDRSARAMFLRERGGQLPAARLLSAPRRLLPAPRR